MAISYKIDKKRRVMIEVMEGYIEYNELFSYVREVTESVDPGSVDYYLADLTKAVFGFSKEENLEIAGLIDKISDRFKLKKMAYVIPSGQIAVTAFEHNRSLIVKQKKRSVQFFDKNEIEEAYKFIGVEDIKKLHREFLSELRAN